MANEQVDDVMTQSPESLGAQQTTRAMRFRTLYDALYDDLWRYCRRRTATDHDAADVLAEVMSVAWRRLDDVPEPPGARPWLFGVARNQLRSSKRGSQRQEAIVQRLSERSRSFSQAITTESADALSEVAAALEQMKPADRELILLVAWDHARAPGTWPYRTVCNGHSICQ